MSKYLSTLLIAALAVGCIADPAPSSTDTALLEAGLPLLDEASPDSDWTAARPGCEGQLASGYSIAIASIEHGLVAAVDRAGRIVCVDTVEAVSEELENTGHEEDAATLLARFEATAAASELAPIVVPAYFGDPHPEPNDCPSCGDPHPEPN